MIKKRLIILVAAFFLILSMMASSWAGEPKAFDQWAKHARIGGAAVWVGMTTQEINTLITKMSNENVSVIEADSELSEYLSDEQFSQNLALMRDFAQAAHAAGLKVVWYYPALEVLTANADTQSHTMFKDHPDWVQSGLNGSPNVFYGGVVFWVEKGVESAWMSPSSPYRDYLYNRVAQIAATGIDGLWMDVPLLNDIGVKWADTNPYSAAAFKGATGLNAPTLENWNDPVWRKWVAWRHVEIAAFLEDLRASCHGINSEFPIFVETVTMDYNSATGIALDGTTLKNSQGITHVWELDAISDTSSMRNALEDDWISMIAMNKFAHSASGSKPAWIFGYGKLEDDAKLVMAEILAAGNNPYETKIPQMTTSIGSAYRTKMFGWIKAFSDLIFDRKSAAKVAVYYSASSRDFVDQNKGVGLYATTTKPGGVAEWWSDDLIDSAYSRQYLADYRGIIKFLVHSHIPFDILTEPDATELSQYQTVIMASVESISDHQAVLVQQYVYAGGHVIMTGPNPTGWNEYGDSLDNYQLKEVLGFNKGESVLPLHKYGEGECRYFADRLGKSYFDTSNASAFNLLKTAVLETSDSLITTNADRRIHFELSQSGENLILHLVNFIGVDGTFSIMPTSFDVNLVLPAGKSASSISVASPDSELIALQPVSFEQNGTSVAFRVELQAYSMFVVALEDASHSAPVLSASPVTPTSGDVTVTITYSPDSAIKTYKLGAGGTWTDYTAPVVISSNTTIFARGTDVLGNVSAEGSLLISNIDKTPPEVPTAVATPSTPTSGDVTVTITYSPDTTNKQYKIGAAGLYSAYTAPVTLSANNTIYFKGQDAAGNWSAEGSLVISNINKSLPETPVMTATPTVPTNGDVTVTITYDTDASIKTYKLGAGGTWTEYTAPVVISSNTTIFARCTDELGNMSPESSLVISNIDKTPPAASTAVATPSTPTSGNVTVTITYSPDTTNKQYKIGAAGLYSAYTAPVTLSANNTVYFKGQDAAGNWSAEGSLVISNITSISVTTPVFSGGFYIPPAILVSTEYQSDSTLNTTQMTAVYTAGSATLSITPDIVDALLNQAKTTGGITENDQLRFVIDTPASFTRLEITFPQSEFKKIVAATDSKVAIVTSLVSMVLDAKTLETISSTEGTGNVIIRATVTDRKILPGSEKTDAESRPVYEFSIEFDSQQISDFGSGFIDLSIPYKLRMGEKPQAIVVYQLRADDSLKIMSGYYDTDIQSVLMKTSHFSRFVIGCNPVSFHDVHSGEWYQEAIEFIAARGITSGTGDHLFSPQENLTRGQFVVMLMNAFQISESTAGHSATVQNFDDAGNTYYTDSLLNAKALGIVSGVGNNLFAPENAITRQEMCVMLYNALSTLKALPKEQVSPPLANFDDHNRVADWAYDAFSTFVGSGIISGSDNRLNPETATTRAEMAQILFNLLTK